MSRARLIIVAVLALAGADGMSAAVNARNGVAINTNTDIDGVTAAISEVNGQTVVASGGVALLVDEQFEGTGYEETWTEGGTGTIDEDYPTSPGEGAQSLHIALTAQNGNTYFAFTAASEAWVRVRFYWNSISSTQTVLSFRDTGSVRGYVNLSGTGTLRVSHGSAQATTATGMSSGQWYYVWLHYVQGTGSDGVADVAWSTDTTRPTSGGQFASVSTGTGTTTTNRLYLGASTNITADIVFDDVKLSVEDYP